MRLASITGSFINQKLALLGLLIAGFSGAATAQTASFKIQADTFASTMHGLTSGDAGPMNQYTVGIAFDVTNYLGNPVSVSTLGFCAEIAQPISAGVSYTFDVISLSSLSASTAGASGTASSNIPTGGIGNLAAARLNYLYDNFYAGTSVLDWNRSEAVPDTVAFQLVQWEITHDSDLNINTGSFWLNSGLNPSLLNTNVINLAQSWLSDIANANVSETYTAKNWDVVALSHPNSQDLVVAFDKGTMVVPEPGSFMLAGLGMMYLFGRRSRKK